MPTEATVLLHGCRTDVRPEGQTAGTVWRAAFEDDPLRRWGFENVLELAVAGHRLTGWPMAVLRDSDGIAFHVMLIAPDGHFTDIAGPEILSVIADRYNGAVAASLFFWESKLREIGWSIDDRVVVEATEVLRYLEGHPVREHLIA